MAKPPLIPILTNRSLGNSLAFLLALKRIGHNMPSTTEYPTDQNRINSIMLDAQSASNPGAAWVAFNYNKPCVLKAVGCTFTGGSFPGNDCPCIGELLYAPHDSPNFDLYAQRWCRGGVVYLPTPGTWMLKFQIPAGITFSAHRLLIAVYDAENPLVAAQYLSLPGTPLVRTVQQQITASVITVLPANYNRIGLIIKNGNGGAANTRWMTYGFGDDTTPGLNVDANITSGLILKPGAVDVLGGDVLPLGPVIMTVTAVGGVPALGLGDVATFKEFYL